MNEVGKNDYWTRIMAVNRVLRGLNPEFKPTIQPGFESVHTILSQDKKYGIIDYSKRYKISVERLEKFIQEAIAFIENQTPYDKNKSALNIVECKYDFSDAIINERKTDASVIIHESIRLKKILKDIYNDNAKLQTLESWEFEEVIAELLFRQGYKVELTQKTKDNGYDIVALLNVNMHNPLKFLVECKRYTNQKVGVEIIRSFKEVIDTEKANRGIIVTTSYFTKGAFNKQREVPYLLDFRDKDKVLEWVNDYFNHNNTRR